MNAKTYLSKIKQMKELIDEQIFYIKELRETLTSISVSLDADKVQTTPDPDKLTNALSKIIDEEKKLEDMKHSFIEFRMKVLEQIHMMGLGNRQKLLYLKYIEDKELRECGDEMGYSYKRVKELHGEALTEFEEKFL